MVLNQDITNTSSAFCNRIYKKLEANILRITILPTPFIMSINPMNLWISWRIKFSMFRIKMSIRIWTKFSLALLIEILKLIKIKNKFNI